MKKLLLLSILLINSASASMECVKLVLGDSDLSVYDSKQAAEICHLYSLGVVKCAQKLDNDDLENDFIIGLTTCSIPEKVSCVKKILDDADLSVYESPIALSICNEYSLDVIDCAQDLDNSGLEDDFSIGLDVCNEFPQHTETRSEVQTEVDIEQAVLCIK